MKTFWSFYCLCFALRELLPAGRNHSLKLLFKESFPRQKAKLWDPNRDLSPASKGNMARFQETVLQELYVLFSTHQACPHPAQKWNHHSHPQTVPTTVGATQWSHSSPGWASQTTEEVQPQGSPGEQETVRGGCISPSGSCRQRDQL